MNKKEFNPSSEEEIQKIIKDFAQQSDKKESEEEGVDKVWKT